jgi:hypothetical protein
MRTDVRGGLERRFHFEGIAPALRPSASASSRGSGRAFFASDTGGEADSVEGEDVGRLAIRRPRIDGDFGRLDPAPEEGLDRIVDGKDADRGFELMRGSQVEGVTRGRGVAVPGVAETTAVAEGEERADVGR